MPPETHTIQAFDRNKVQKKIIKIFVGIEKEIHLFLLLIKTNIYYEQS